MSNGQIGLRSAVLVERATLRSFILPFFVPRRKASGGGFLCAKNRTPPRQLPLDTKVNLLPFPLSNVLPTPPPNQQGCPAGVPARRSRLSSSAARAPRPRPAPCSRTA